MTDNQIKAIIEEFKNRNKYEEAFIGFYQEGGGPDESYIKANRKGLELHIAELLDATLKSKVQFEKEKDRFHAIDTNFNAGDTEFCFQYIELLKEDRKEIITAPFSKESWSEKLLKYGFIILGLFLLMIFIIGFITFLKWLF